jgi:hypothetical protein
MIKNQGNYGASVEKKISMLSIGSNVIMWEWVIN